MSAETLRKAASLMRERAEAFREDGEFVNRWSAHPTLDPENEGWLVAHDWDGDFDSTVAHLRYDYEGAVARHIAGMHPAVALAVANRLNTAAWQWEQIDKGNAWGDVRLSYAHLEDDLAVARAYLGEAS